MPLEEFTKKKKKQEFNLNKAMEKVQDNPQQSPQYIQKVAQQDQSQMRDEIIGKTIGEFIYDFKVGGRRVVGLTYAGVIQAARDKGDIKVTEIKVKESEDGKAYEAEVTAADTRNRFEIKAVARQLKVFKDGTPNDFAYTIAASKATRNALRRLLPEQFIKNVVEAWLTKKEQEKKDAKQFM